LEISPALGFLDQTHWEIALALINRFCDFHTNFLGTLTILTLLARRTDFPVPVSIFGQAFIARLLTDSIFHQRVSTGAFLTHHRLSLLISYKQKTYSHRWNLESRLIDQTVLGCFPLKAQFASTDIAVHFLRAIFDSNTIPLTFFSLATLLADPIGDFPPFTTLPTLNLGAISTFIQLTMGK
jgi:hypothetical protein